VKRLWYGVRVATLIAAVLSTHVSLAQQEDIEVRAARVCAGIIKQAGDFDGSFKVDNLTVQGTGNGTYTIRRDGVDLGKFEGGTFKDHSMCLVEVIKLLANSTDKSRPVPLSQAHFEFTEGIVPGGFLISFSNPTPEDVQIYDVTYHFPNGFATSLCGKSLGELGIIDHILLPTVFPGNAYRAAVRAKSASPLPIIIAGCEPQAKVNSQVLMEAYKGRKLGGTNATCTLCMKASSLGGGEVELCKNNYCVYPMDYKYMGCP
jgi:hypothetical protein